jgi:hypothetical protein
MPPLRVLAPAIVLIALGPASLRAQAAPSDSVVPRVAQPRPALPDLAPGTAAALRESPLPLDSVPNGAWIRLVAPGFGLGRAAVLERRMGDTLLVARPDKQLLRRVVLDSVFTLQLAVGRAPSEGRSLRAMGIGVAVGLGFAQLLNWRAENDPSVFNGTTVAAAGLGGLAGWLLGSGSREEVWRPVRLRATADAPAP